MAAISAAPFPLTRGRLAALVIGVPVCLSLIAVNGLSLVANLGEAHYPVNYAVVAGAKSLNVSVASGQLLIKQAAGSQATLTGTARYSLIRSKLTEQTTSSGTDVRYHCVIPFGACELDATASVPAGLPVTANTDGGNAQVTGTTGAVTLSSGGGDIHADHAAGTLALNTSGGNIQATDLTSATLTATTGGGDIHADGVQSHTVSVTTSGGNIQASGIAAPKVTATTGGGDIEIDFTSVPSDVRVDTSGGNITLVLPRVSTTYHVTAHTNGGNVTNSLPQNSRSTNVITATSGGGNITIRQR
jgi:Putative adhesin